MRFLVFVYVLAAIGCARHQDARAESAPTATTMPVTKVTRADLSGHLVLTAEFAPFQEVEVMSKVSGYVKSISVDIGDRVRESQVLATLEIPEMQDDLARAAASVQQADADVATASDELHRTESAHEMVHLSYTRIQEVAKREVGLVPQQEVDEIRSRDLVAEAQVASAKSSIRGAEQKAHMARAEEARVKTMFRYTAITAPFAGVITKRYANTGSMVQAGTASQTQAMPVVRVSQNSVLRLILPVPESAVSRVRVGETVDVRVPSLSRSIPGRVARFTDKVQQSTRTMDTEVDVANPTLTLRPGMFAEVDLQIEQQKNVLSLPLEAIERTADAARAYAVNEGGVVRVVPLVLGLETAQRVEIRSGLSEGDVVITGRHAGIKSGDKVQPKFVEFAMEKGR